MNFKNKNWIHWKRGEKDREKFSKLNLSELQCSEKNFNKAFADGILSIEIQSIVFRSTN